MSTPSASARYQRQVENLLKEPGNDTCADCAKRGPRWASVSLGIFLCEQCAAIHRKMGTSVSRVKSISLDNWDKTNVDAVRNVGNNRSNASYNPKGERPVQSLDPDDNGRALEQFIRRKYEKRAYQA